MFNLKIKNVNIYIFLIESEIKIFYYFKILFYNL